MVVNIAGRFLPSVTYPAGSAPVYTEVGDFILVDRGNYVGRLIRWVTRSKWNHAALVVSTTGDLTEALVRTGITRSHISKYLGMDYVVVHTNGAPNDQAHLLRYAERSVGQGYGFGQCLSVIIGYLTFGRVVFTTPNPNCSAHVALGQLRLGAYFDKMAQSMVPGDLAKYYGVSPK